MSRREISRTVQDETHIPGLKQWLDSMVRDGLRGGPVMVVLTRERRNKDQNAKLWAMLRDIARQCQLTINGERVYAGEEDWKDVFTAALTGEQRMAQGINGGVVMLGRSTSKMRKQEFSELIELILAYGAEHGVQWSEQSRREVAA